MRSAGSRGDENPQGSIPAGRGALVQEGRSVGWGRRQAGAGSRAAGHWGAPRVSARVPLFAAGGWYKGPRFSRLREDRMIFTSSLAAFAHLWGTCPPPLSRSTQGSRMGLGGWLRSCDGPRSAWGSAQRQPDPRPLWQGRQAHEAGGHQAPMLGLGGARRAGAQRLNKPRGPAASAVTVLLRSCPRTFLLQRAELPTGFPSFLPCLQGH